MPWRECNVMDERVSLRANCYFAVERVMRQERGKRPKTLTSDDPACGSGAFEARANFNLD